MSPSYLQQVQAKTIGHLRLKHFHLKVHKSNTAMATLMVSTNNLSNAPQMILKTMVHSVHSVSRRKMSAVNTNPTTFIKLTNKIFKAHQMFLKAVNIAAQTGQKLLPIARPECVTIPIHPSPLVRPPHDARKPGEVYRRDQRDNCRSTHQNGSDSETASRNSVNSVSIASIVTQRHKHRNVNYRPNSLG